MCIIRCRISTIIVVCFAEESVPSVARSDTEPPWFISRNLWWRSSWPFRQGRSNNQRYSPRYCWRWNVYANRRSANRNLLREAVHSYRIALNFLEQHSSARINFKERGTVVSQTFGHYLFAKDVSTRHDSFMLNHRSPILLRCMSLLLRIQFLFPVLIYLYTFDRKIYDVHIHFLYENYLTENVLCVWPKY